MSAATEPARATTGATLRDALAWSLAAGVIVAIAEFASSQHGIGDGWRDRVDWFARMVVHWVLAAAPFGFAFAWLDRRAAERVPPWHEYALVVAVVSAVVIPVLAWIAPLILEPEVERLLDGRPDFRASLRFLAWQVVFWAVLGALLHRYDVAGRLAVQRLRRAELARAAREHDVGRASMRATWARVVPGFLLDALRRVHALYGRAPLDADRAITALVAYLRLALSHHRRGVVPVASEARLAAAYLAACDDRLRDPEAGVASEDAVIESGIVVPALHRLRASVVPAGGRATATVGVHVARERATFRVRLEVETPGATASDLAAPGDVSGDDGPRIGAIREAGGSWMLTITVPLAPSRAGDDGREAATADPRAFPTPGGDSPWTNMTSTEGR